MIRNRLGEKIVLGLGMLSGIVFLGASAHFIYLASSTQPECVAHKKIGDVPEKGFSAAKSSC